MGKTIAVLVANSMTELDQLIESAIKSEGKQEDVNKVYLLLLKSRLFVPVKKLTEAAASEEEPFSPLFAKIEDQFFMAVFDTDERLVAWAGDKYLEIDTVELSGRDVIAGINENVYLCLNVGTKFYKEFSPDEIKRLKMVVTKIDQLIPKT
jgi:hypothetical protein